MIRRLAGIMRRMLLTGQEFRWVHYDRSQRTAAGCLTANIVEE
jgi:hypothetical protein